MGKGNATRTRNQIRGSKSKGAQYEYSVRDSLEKVIPGIVLTKQEGFVKQYDLKSDITRMSFECKKHKSITWNQAKKWFEKLESKTPEGYEPYLVFQSNRQPCLVMYRGVEDGVVCVEFETCFDAPFIKHGAKKIKGGSK